MTYDRLDWHLGSAIEAGQPPENSFTHIGLYLAWLIRHDLHDPAMFPAGHVSAVRAGEMTGSDLADDIDGKLLDVMLTAEGREFSDARYGAYTAAFEAAFSDAEPYSIADDEAARARIDPVVDDLFATWVAAGRPAPARDTPAAGADVPPGPDAFALRSIQESIDAISLELSPASPTGAHVAPALEMLIPQDLTDPPLAITLVSATQLGSTLLRRSLRRLEVRPADVTIANAIGGRGEKTLVVMLTAIPSVDRDRLLDEFRSVIPVGRGSWQTRLVAGKAVEWTTAPEFSTAFWTLDGLVVQVSARADLVEAAIPRLP